MREIKFRGKRVDNSEWVYGDLLQPFNTDNKRRYYILDYSKFEYDCFEHIGEVAEEFEVIPESVGQFTGLLDKNGKEIYEGDICKINYFGKEMIVYVKWDYFKWCLFSNKYKTYSGDFSQHLNEANGFGNILWVKIIGNIHDNPELFEVSNA